MHFTDDEATEVKGWVVKKLEDMYVRILMRFRELLFFLSHSVAGLTPHFGAKIVNACSMQ
jgi:hypothetical protein